MLKRLMLVFILSLSFLIYSCSSKNETKTGNTENKQTQPTNNNSTSQQKKYFDISSTSEVAGGKQAVDFSWNENGNDMNMAALKGNVVLVNFWATWCPPCRAEIPALNSIAGELKDRNFKMIGVSIDDKKADLDKFMAANPLSYTILHEKGILLEKYMKAGGVVENVVPQTFIVNKDGKIVEAILGSKSKAEFLQLINKHL